LIIVLFITVTGFTVDTDVINDHTKVGDSSTREFLVLLVASMAFLSLILLLLANALDYNSKINMHKSAAIDLESLGDRIKLYRVERTMDQEAMEEEEERLAEVYHRKGSDSETVVTESTAGDDTVDLEAGNVPPNLNHNGALMVLPENGGQLAVSNSLADAIAKQKAVINKSMKQQQKIDAKNEALTKTLVMQKVAQAKRDRENIKNVVEYYGYSVTLQQITVGCKSDVPMLISKFFDVMESRVELMSLSRTLGVAQDENAAADESSGRMRKNQIIRLCANEICEFVWLVYSVQCVMQFCMVCVLIYSSLIVRHTICAYANEVLTCLVLTQSTDNEINGYWAWPLFAPSVDGAIERSLKRVGQLLNMNYRARKRCKLLPCCSIPLCCKKKSSSNVFAIINEGIDQRELDMMQVERMELMRLDRERKARRMKGISNPDEVLEMKSLISDRDVSKKKPKQPRGMRGEDMSLPSIDPDGETFAGMVTEGTASTYSRQSRASGSVGNAHSRARDPGGFQVRSVTSSRGAGQAGSRHFDDDISQLEDEEASWLYDEAAAKKKKKKSKVR
jgi:hypothetical protein